MLPPNQSEVDDLIRLDLGYIPDIDINDFKLEISGDVKNKLDLTYEEFLALGLGTVTDNFHCVTGWSKLNAKWEGVLASKIIEKAMPAKNAKFVLIYSYDGYSTNTKLEDFSAKNSIFAIKYMDNILKKENGYPVRLVISSKYAYKSAKWVRKIIFLSREELGYWEQRGYSNSADPFKEERYS